MPRPQSGKPGSPVPPTDPQKPEPADKADPGAMNEIKAEQRQNERGKYGSVPLSNYRKPTDPEEKKKKPGWIEVVLVDEENKPVSGARYRVTLPDGTVAGGSLDDKGLVRIQGIDPGSCQITFPDLDKDAWKKA